MPVTIKSNREIEIMREAGKRLADVYEELIAEIKPGMSTYEIDQIGEKLIRSHGCIPECKGYEGYPAAFCVSVNNVVVHGIPRKNIIVGEGDIVSLDTALSYKGYMADAARTIAIGEIREDVKQLLDVTKQCFYEGIKYAKPGYHLNDISTAIGSYAEKFGYGVVKDLVGHGIGREMHEEPQIPNFKQKRRGIKLQPGMTLCIEPMINMGGWQVDFLDDEWTVITRDGSFSAHYENTILITKDEPEILTIK